MKSAGKSRFSVSVDPELQGALDDFTARSGFPNRSQALSALIRGQLSEQLSLVAEGKASGTVTLVYDHHKRNLCTLLTDIQHTYSSVISSSLHVHLDHVRCMEIIAVSGDAAVIRALADRLIATKGVLTGKLALFTF